MIINDSNWQQFINPTVNGEVKRCSCFGMSRYVLGGWAGRLKPLRESSVKVIPQTEWDDRIAQERADHATLRDLAEDGGLDVLDQDGTNYCASEDTEVLTERGWVAWPDYNWRDLLGTMNRQTGMLEFQAPLQKHVYEHRGDMIVSEHKRCRFSVTPDHKLLIAPNKGRAGTNDIWSDMPAKALPHRCRIPAATKGWLGVNLHKVSIPGGRIYTGDDFVQLVSAIVSDGFAGQAVGNGGQVATCCYDEKRYPAFKALMERVGFVEQKKRGQFSTWDNALATWVRQNCYHDPALHSHNKRVPRLVMELSQRQIELFLASYGDQSHGRPMSHYFSTSYKLLGDIQELFLRIGRRATITLPKQSSGNVTSAGVVITRRHPLYELTAARSQRLTIYKREHLHREPYDGLVYCAGVPNHTLVTRKDGDILISANCWSNGVVYSYMLAQFAATGVARRYSPASVAAPITNFRNVGGWGDQAVKGMMERGVNLIEDWPPNAISREYYTDENKEKARLNIPFEVFRCDSWEETVSAILNKCGVGVGYNWWGHLVCGIGITEREHDLVIANSWGQGWGEQGFGTLEGSRKYPDGVAIAIVATAAG